MASNIFIYRARAQVNSNLALACFVSLLKAISTNNEPAGGEIGAFDYLHKLFNLNFWVIYNRASAVYNLCKIVRGYIGC